MFRRISIAAFCCAAISGAFQTPDPQTATFHAGTRLVEIEVVVRGKQGPVKGLTKDDFTVLDHGKPQRMEVFRAGQASTDTAAAPLAPGAVSNRVSRLGETLPSTTVVLFDQINSRLDLKDYESKAMVKLIRGLGRDLLPANVHDALFDFPTDATGEIEGISWRVASRKMNAEYKGSIEHLAETNAAVNVATNDSITIEALMRIVEHLSGMPGRRNLVWVKEDPIVPPAVMGMLLQANISLYPVLIRTVEYGTLSDAPDIIGTQRAGRALAAMTGGAGFDDAGDLQLAVKTAEEDSQNAYTLGYYPSEDVLDGNYHRLGVSVAGEKSAHLEIRYRPGYVATKQELARVAPPLADVLGELFADPLDATAIGITAQFRPDTQPGQYQVRVTVDLHDVHLERAGDRSTGKIEVAFPLGDNVRVRTLGISLTDDQLAEDLKTGFTTIVPGIEASGNAIRLVVRDPSTGVAGSLRIPLRQ